MLLVTVFPSYYRNIPRAIICSVFFITLVYVAANVAYFVVLSPSELLTADAVAVVSGLRRKTVTGTYNIEGGLQFHLSFFHYTYRFKAVDGCWRRMLGRGRVECCCDRTFGNIFNMFACHLVPKTLITVYLS